MFQSAGGVEAGGRNATVPGGRGEPERGGSQQTQGPAGVGYPAGEQAHQDSPAGEQGAAGGSGGAPGSAVQSQLVSCRFSTLKLFRTPWSSSCPSTGSTSPGWSTVPSRTFKD